MQYVWMAIIGFIVGLVARAILPGTQKLGIILTALLGIVGSFIAGLASSRRSSAPSSCCSRTPSSEATAARPDARPGRRGALIAQHLSRAPYRSRNYNRRCSGCSAAW
jgi:hypothetical protein